MKFLITENKLEQIVFRYLDNKNFTIKETVNEYYFLENKDDRFAQILVTKKDKECFIYIQLFDEISPFFSLGTIETAQIITRYVEKTLNFELDDTFIRRVKDLMQVRHI